MSPSANQSGGAAATVYTAGQDSSGNACYWTGTSETSLQGGGLAESVFVINGTVYTAGRDSAGYPCYWTGAIETRLSAVAQGTAISICVDGKTNIYTAGFDGTYACYWVAAPGYSYVKYLYTTGSSGANETGSAESVFVDNGTVYTSGYDSAGCPCYWVGIAEKTRVNSGVTGSSAYSVFESKNVVYTAGIVQNNPGQLTACFWTGTVQTNLSLSGSWANSIFVYNGSVYTSGYDSANYACYWTGTVETPLANGSKGFARSIYILDGTAYTAGYDGGNKACYWTGTAETPVPGALSIYAVFAVR